MAIPIENLSVPFIANEEITNNSTVYFTSGTSTYNLLGLAYSAPLTAGKTVHFKVNGGNTDTYLYILNSVGAIVASDDDSGGNRQAERSYTPSQTGTYYFIATSYNKNVTFSANITIDIPKYPLVVNKGSGDGSYEKIETISISADTAPAGKVFKEWSITSGAGTFGNKNSANTTFSMTSNGATITATYDNPFEYTIYADHAEVTGWNTGYDAVIPAKIEGVTITSIDLSEEYLDSLDVSDCIGLKTLDCSDNDITELDVSFCKSLETVNCAYNDKLTALNVSGCSLLTELDCSYASISAIDISDCIYLDTFYCLYNKLSSLDVSSCTALRIFRCDGNELNSLDVSRCPALKTLCCGGNNLTTLNVSACTALETFYCRENNLSTIDISKNTKLKNFNCYSNRISNATLLASLAGRFGKANVVPQQTGYPQDVTPKYSLVVTGGIGAGSYAKNSTINIKANAPANGKRFKEWVITAGTGTFGNKNSATTTFKMTSNGATIAAIYEDIPKIAPTVTPPKSKDKAPAAKKEAVPEPKTVAIPKVTPAKKAFTVKIKKPASKYKIKKYYVRYKVKGTKKWQTKVFSGNATSFKIKKLKSKKKYSFQVRAKNSKGKYGKWSKAKTVRVK
jgi:Leucine-rich repeat (LRR) protein